MNFEEKTKNQGTRQPEASQEKVNGDMAAELVELDDVELATVVGGSYAFPIMGRYGDWRDLIYTGWWHRWNAR